MYLRRVSVLPPDTVWIHLRCLYSVLIGGPAIDRLSLLFVAGLCTGVSRFGSFRGRSVHFIEKHADAYNGGGRFPVL